MFVVAVLLPALAVFLGAIIGMAAIFYDAARDSWRRRGGRRPSARIQSQAAKTLPPNFYLRRWGAYKRGSVKREKALWDEDFARAEDDAVLRSWAVVLHRAGGPQQG